MHFIFQLDGVHSSDMITKAGISITENWLEEGWLNIKMPSYLYENFRCGAKTILRPTSFHNGISYTGNTTSSYWIMAQVLCNDFITH